ncbi:MAG: TonB-dependent receptor [Hyphomonadaceae bacterium]|nr:TonB-dependent receptor [Hyphomonadaceae bacterium]
MGKIRVRSAFLLTATAVALAGVAAAQTAPADEPMQQDEIVVVAEQGDQVRIDRRTYAIANDPVAQSTDMFEALGRIPSVSVSPEGEVSLLGAGGVTIEVNGQPVPGNSLEQILRGLQGAQVERIEVITNPSAQYSAAASGGIINIITRQQRDVGASGSASVGVNSAQGYLVNVGPSWSRGPWSVSFWAGLNHNESERDYRRVRRDFASGDVTTDTGAIERRSDVGHAWLQLGYKPDDQTSFSASANITEGGRDQQQPIARSDSIGPVQDDLTDASRDFSYRAASFDYQREGDQPRQLLKFNLAIDQDRNDEDQLISETPFGGALSRFATRYDENTETASSKLDYETPIGARSFLSLGLAADGRLYASDNSVQALIGAPDVTDYAASLDARDQTLAAYATYQIEAGDWTILPGLRVENYRREVVGDGGESDDADTRTFPTVHLRRALTDNLGIDLSYSSRIERPELDDLDPTIRFEDATHAESGNPNLRPTTTDAFEASLNWQGQERTFSLTFFDRIREDIVSPFTQQIGDVTLETDINAGTSDQRGVQAIWRGPFGARWRYSLSGSALSNAFDVLDGATMSRRSEFEYSGNVQLEYRDPDQARIGANNVALEVRLNGPTHNLQGETAANTQTNITWRRRLTPQAFGVLILQDVFSSQDSISTSSTSSFTERTERLSQGVRLRLSLTYQWGAGSDRMQERDAPDGGAPVQ